MNLSVVNPAVGVACSMAAGLAIGAAVFCTVEGYLGVSFLISMIAVLCVVAIVVEIRTSGDFLTATGMFSIGLVGFFVLRPIGILVQRTTTAGAEIDSRVLSEALESALATSLVQVLILSTCAFGVYWILLCLRRDGGRGRDRIAFISRTRSVANDRTSAVLVWLASALAIFSAAILVARSGGFIDHFDSVANRSASLRGVNFLVYSYLPLLAALVVHLVNRRVIGRKLDAPSCCGLVVLIAVTALSGGRGPLIFGAVLPLLILLQTGSRRLSQGILTLILGFGGVVALGYAVLVRDRAFRPAEMGVDAEEGLIATIWDRALSGSEFRPLDSLIRLNEAASVGDLALQNGNTYLASFAWFVPRGLWPGKPGGGANTWFTQTLLPRFYGPERVETSVSVVGEAYLNFSWFGLVLVGTLIGCLLFALSRSRIYEGGILRVALVVVTSPVLVSFLRGDAYQNVGVFLALVLLVIGAYGLSARRVSDGVAFASYRERVLS
ncbi:O-antigen ligase [Gordonia amicalis]|uniref:O-antigen polymerase n=1 Tax=Gordonia amicalis TaxID=89053 RepID=UPI0022B4263A|nr:O-antigen polymerase [Gordonia amicalis]MCZ4581841.1 O-antigen ligase [Gordonia amicalis]